MTRNRLITAISTFFLAFCNAFAAGSTGTGHARPDTLTLIFAGDLMQHKEQLNNALIPGESTADPEAYDYSDYFRHIRKHVSSADLAIINLETTIGSIPYSGYPCFSAPASLIEETAEAGFDIFLCANNHIADKGAKGIGLTIKALEEGGYGYTGAYRDMEDYEDNSPLIVECKGMKIALVNFTYGINGRNDAPSPYIVPMMDKAQIGRMLEKAAEKGADLIIAAPHWGVEYCINADRRQREWAEFMHEKGADIIVGTHPHVLQETETEEFDGKIRHITAYSLGNLVSNMSKKFTRIGKLLKIDIVRLQSGETEIAGYEEIWTWCSLGGRYEKGYTVLPVEEFMDISKWDRNIPEYYRMSETYKELKRHYGNE